MRMTEMIVAISIFLIASAVFTASLINVRRSVSKSEVFSKNAVVLLDTDTLIRKEIRKIHIPYWKNFEKEFEKEKIFLEEKLRSMGETHGFDVSDISFVYDKKKFCEGIKVEWKIYGRKYVCQEYIKQRIVNEE